MRRSHTVPIELFASLANGPYESEPYEAGWASEAIAFVYVREVAGPDPRLELRAQGSADGQRWVDLGAAFPPQTAPGGALLRLTHFGNWLRLVGAVSGGPSSGPAAIVDIYWVFKE
ncbi:MAG: hypothetical protein KatS3mg060_3298 [Dehalococcoidia bacterium]|nr:MAG: hypothetical protein KatS3mg060_3298 [Dehalococcoidia bacterium]